MSAIAGRAVFILMAVLVILAFVAGRLTVPRSVSNVPTSGPAVPGQEFAQPFWPFMLNHYYPVDEPDRLGTPLRRLQALYAGRPAPVYMTFVGCNDLARFRAVFDVAVADWYPFDTVNSDAAALASWRAMVRTCVATLRTLHKPPPVMVVQAFGNVIEGGEHWRCTTATQRAQMIADARRLGAAQVLLYPQRPSSGQTACPPGS